MSKALELADKLEKLTESGLWYDGKPAAAELRRLAAVEEERDALKDELERHLDALDQEMVVSHLGVFNRGDDPRAAINKLMLWSQGVGDYFGRQAELERIKAMEPVAWLRFWAYQRVTHEGVVDADEGYEVCKKTDIGMDRRPAFPVYTLEKP